jgi:16S rRNA (guanine(966)-N(2))-methyltransferase RsmD
MRIIGGTLKGRKFYPPSKIKARPTTDIAREALFNVLAQHLDIKDIRVLDLFFGTGGVGLEFLSRGAAHLTSIDIDIVSKKFLDQLVGDWGLKNVKVVKADVFKLIKNTNDTFDLVFADPPYADPRFPEMPDMMLQSGWVKPGGWFILEHSDAHRFEEHPDFSFHRNYGSVNFSFFRKD